MIEKKVFGNLADGTQVTLYTIRNSAGEYAELLDYGATLHSLFVRDKHGAVGDVLLGIDQAEKLGLGAFEGSTIGRCANRIANGRYTINGKTTQLECNYNGHFLHGASGNYASKMFTGEMDAKNDRVLFRLLDTGEAGFGCEVEVQVAYSFGDDHTLTIAYELQPLGDTILCPTNHAFFNLSGGDIRDHCLQINADEIACKGEYGVPNGETSKVQGSYLDFFSMKRIGDALQTGMNAGVYDDYFLLHQDRSAPAAKLYSPETGRMMRVFTDMPAVIVFTPVVQTPKAGKGGMEYIGYCAICLETQYVPNAVNCDRFQTPYFRKGEKLVTETAYAFDVLA